MLHSPVPSSEALRKTLAKAVKTRQEVCGRYFGLGPGLAGDNKVSIYELLGGITLYHIVLVLIV
jgi:hypothetical protein